MERRLSVPGDGGRSATGSSLNNSVRKISRARNVFALVAYGSNTPPYARLMFAAYEDGTVVWSGERTLGGAPYFTAKIDSSRLANTLERLEKDGLFSDLPLSLGFVPSSECSCFVVRKGPHVLELESAHEQFEQASNIVAEHRAMVPLGSRQRFEVLASQPRDYIFSRMIWLELRRLMEEIIPGNGVACDGELEMLHAELSWVPST